MAAEVVEEEIVEAMEAETEGLLPDAQITV